MTGRPFFSDDLWRGSSWSILWSWECSLAPRWWLWAFSQQVASLSSSLWNHHFTDNIFIDYLFTAICVICLLTIRMVWRNISWLFLMMIYSCHSKLHHHHLFFTDNLFTAICIICSLTIRPVWRELAWLTIVCRECEVFDQDYCDDVDEDDDNDVLFLWYFSVTVLNREPV